MSALVLPVVTIQHDVQTVVADVDAGLVPLEDIWVSCYKSGEPSVHGKARVTLDEHDRAIVRLKGRGGIDVRRARTGGRDGYEVACPPLRVPFTSIALPSREFRDPERSSATKPHAITAFDVSPDGTQLATGYHDGTVHLLPTARPASPQLQKARPHLSSVTALRFFPSSRVLLTAGNDFTLTILPAAPLAAHDHGAHPPALAPARTLRAHTRAITATAIVERGKNVLSAGKDAAVRLWDVAAGAQIRAFAAAGYAPVLAMALGERAELVLPAPAPVQGDRGADVDMDADADGGAPARPANASASEVGTAGKLAFCALGDGAFEAFDLGGPRATCVFRASPSAGAGAGAGAALGALAYSPRHSLLATGSAAGLVQLWDTRALGAPVCAFTRGPGGVEDLAFVDLAASSASASSAPVTPNGAVGLAVATADGLPFLARVDGARVDVDVWAELVGPDCERVAGLRVRGVGGWGDEGGAEVWTAADDGVVRCY